MKILLRASALLGLLLFGGLFVVSYVAPIEVERAAVGFITLQVENKARASIDTLSSDARFGPAAARLAGLYGDRAQALQRQLADGLAEKVATTVAQMQDLDCDCRRLLAERMRDGIERDFAALGQARSRLQDLLRGLYADVVAQLLRDVRIFTGSNAVVFALLLIASLTRQRAAAQLVLPGMLLLATTLVASGVYMFGQDWFYTVVFGSYVGFGYTAWLAAVSVLLGDILFNRARVTTELCNALLSAVANATPLSPC